jgi:hypothetical protein
MKRALVILATIAAPVMVLAQPSAPITATPLLPPSVQYPNPGQPPGERPVPQVAPAQQPDTATAPNQPQSVQMTWLPQGSALLQVLDKVNAQSSELTVKVGQQAQFGALNIQVQACDIHPADEPRDAAAYLTITDGHTDTPGFRGWMLANDPSVSMLENPIYDVRVVGCRA